MRLMIIIAVLIYWLLPVDIAPGPIDDMIIALAGALLAALTPPKDCKMKNLSELSDEQKSVMLARLCGWGVSRAMAGTKYESVFIYTQNNQWFTNLYDPANMSAAWQVLNRVWSYAHKMETETKTDFPASWDYGVVSWSSALDGIIDGELEPQQAQRAWLDTVLSLAIEAGMLEVNHAND